MEENKCISKNKCSAIVWDENNPITKSYYKSIYKPRLEKEHTAFEEAYNKACEKGLL